MPAHPGRNVSTEFRRNRLIVLQLSSTCHLCGHDGALTVDHIVPFSQWPAGMPGVDSLGNLAPAHGSRGPTRPPNRCRVCGKLCNQSRKDAPLREIRSRPAPPPSTPERPQSRRW